MSEQWTKRLTLVAIFGLGFCFRWLSLHQTDFANGWDAYYYLIQIQSYTSTGSMHSSEWNLYYLLLLIIDWFFNNPISSVKLISSLLAALLGFVAFNIVYFVRKSYSVSLLVSLFFIFSPELTYFAAQWPKNLLGLVVYAFLIHSLVRKSYIELLVLLILGYFCHRMTALLGLMTVFLWLFSNKTSNRYKVYFLFFSLLGLASIHFVPGLFTFYDFERFNSMLSFHFEIQQVSFYNLLGSEKINIFWRVELIISFLLFVLFAGNMVYKAIKKIELNELELPLFLIFFLLWFPFFQLDTSNVPYRLFHAGVVLAPFLLTFFNYNFFKGLPSYFFAGLLLIFSFFSWRSYVPSLHDPDYKTYKIIAEKLENYWIQNDKPELIIGHKALAELITFETGVDVLPWLPEYKIEEERLYRIAYLPFPKLFKFYVKKDPLKLTKNYFYITEVDWQHFYRQVSDNEIKNLINLHKSWMNPNQVRPDYLLKN